MSTERRSYTEESKREAVRLMEPVANNLINGAVSELMALNGYNYANGNAVVNLTDPSGLCQLQNEPGLVNQVDARQCKGLVNALDRWNIGVVWDEWSLSSVICLPDTVELAASQGNVR